MLTRPITTSWISCWTYLSDRVGDYTMIIPPHPCHWRQCSRRVAFISGRWWLYHDYPTPTHATEDSVQDVLHLSVGVADLNTENLCLGAIKAGWVISKTSIRIRLCLGAYWLIDNRRRLLRVPTAHGLPSLCRTWRLPRKRIKADGTETDNHATEQEEKKIQADGMETENHTIE